MSSEFVEEPVALAGRTIEVDVFVKELEEELVGQDHNCGVVAHTARIFLFINLVLGGLSAVLCDVELAQTWLATPSLALGTLQDVLLHRETDGALEVLKLDPQT